MDVIALHEVSKTIRGNVIFDSVTAHFEGGGAYGVTGPNGSGKSVLFKLICGFMVPSRGEIVIAQQFRPKGVRYPRDFGVVVDRPAFHPDLSAAENLRRLASIRGTIGDLEIAAALDRVGLSFAITQRARNFSLGMKQKLGIAQAIMEDQRVLLLDEPFNALDEEALERVREIMLSAKRDGKTIIFTSHNREDIDAVADAEFRIDSSKLKRVR